MYGRIPEWDPKPNETVIIRPSGGAVTLRCRGSGDPKPLVVWFRNRRIIDEANSYVRILTMHVYMIKISVKRCSWVYNLQ